MKVINYSNLRENLKKVLDSVAEDKVNYIINRGEESVVLMSMDEFNGWKETIYLLSSKPNSDRLLRAVERDKKGNYLTKKLISE